MKSYVDVLELKRQENIAEEYTGEDRYLSRLLLVAQVSVEKHIGYPLDTFVSDGNLNPMIEHAILVLASHFYANREPVAYVRPYAIPYTFEYLLQPFKKYT